MAYIHRTMAQTVLDILQSWTCWSQGLASSWILTSRQPHRVTSGRESREMPKLSNRLTGKSNCYKRPVSRKSWSVQELETLPASIKPMKPQPAWDRCRKRKRSTIIPQRTRKGHRQTDEHCKCFKGNSGVGTHMGFSERADTVLNWSELNWPDHSVVI